MSRLIHFNDLTPGEAERLAMLAEECAEVIQIVGKILRHGYDSYHPDDPSTSNRRLLAKELMDVRTVIRAMAANYDVNHGPTDFSLRDAWSQKCKFTHHQWPKNK